MIYLDLILNLSLLVALSIVSGFVEKRYPRDTRPGVLLQGILFGGVAIIGMLRPLNLGPGLIFDGRSIMVSLCALYFGPWAGAAAAALTILCRIGLGGAGTLMGVTVILSSVGIGLLAHYRLTPDTHPPSKDQLYFFGIIVHLAMLAAMFTLPDGAGLTVIKQLGLPVMLLYPLTTILAGKILSDQVLAIQTMAVLKESETLFRNIFEHHAAVKLIIDPDTGGIIDVNQAAESFYGWPKDRLRQMKIQDINTLSPEEINREMEKAGLQKKEYFEFRHRRADGSIRDVAVFSSRIVVKGKTLLHSIIHDITDQKQTETMLQTTEAKYRDLFENAPIGIFSATFQGRPVSLNTAMARILGLDSPRDVLERYTGLREDMYVNPEKRDEFLKELQEKGRVENFEYQARTADGRIIWLNTHARMSRKNADGEFIVDGFTTDVTAQHKLEEQFRQAQKMESVGRLAGGVAHDYNNMLGVILGYTEMAIDKVTPSDPIHEDLQEVLQAARRSAEITRQLLAFARKQTISPKVIDLNETVEGMLKMLRRLIGEDIDLAWLPKGKLWPIKMDPSQLDQILANLCVNARDAILDVGKITIETERVTFDQAYCDDHSGFVSGDFVMLAVSDDGCGMDQDTREKIFEPFFTTKGVGQGTGLGLAMIYGIVKQNNGFINVYSEPDKGTTFRIYFPRDGGEISEIDKVSSEDILPGHGETILIVEDDGGILNLSRTMLEKMGYVVLTANSTGEAMRLAEAHAGNIRMLLTDVVMPEMNGHDLAEKLMKLNPNLTVLFMSGYTANVIAHRGVLDKGVSFIQKPFSMKDLSVRVHETLGQITPHPESEYDPCTAHRPDTNHRHTS